MKNISKARHIASDVFIFVEEKISSKAPIHNLLLCTHILCFVGHHQGHKFIVNNALYSLRDKLQTNLSHSLQGERQKSVKWMEEKKKGSGRSSCTTYILYVLSIVCEEKNIKICSTSSKLSFTSRLIFGPSNDV